MKPPSDLPLEVVLVMEAFARRLKMEPGDFWAVVYREKPAPPGWAAMWSEAFAPLVSLTSQHIPSTVGDVNTNPSSNALRSQAQMADEVKEHRLVAAITKRGLTFADVAEALEARLKGRRFPRSTVQSWVKPEGNTSYRAIPQDAADALKALYAVPLSAWPRIIPG